MDDLEISVKRTGEFLLFSTLGISLMTIFCTFLDMVDVRGGREHAWAQTKMTKMLLMIISVGCFGQTALVIWKFICSAFCCLLYSAENQWRGVISGSQGVTDRRGLQLGSDRQERAPSKWETRSWRRHSSAAYMSLWSGQDFWPLPPSPHPPPPPVCSVGRYVHISFNHVMGGRTAIFCVFFFHQPSWQTWIW